ncbi:homoserine kinase [Methylacidiphilum sp. Yel]|uniref:homoserine kinase n=1 Tax=Methylacidiphilum sp. Yel TaxID=1847730 RepID=UPI00106AD107|nr:homoserine kinase [Methylacidiphilum sp. Yel]TFE70216.1 homoserine kinase [Methylacidiphilum sp. Yel]
MLSVRATNQKKRWFVKVPATTTNFGPGFDTFGAALSLYNEFIIEAIDDSFSSPDPYHPMVFETVKAFEKKIQSAAIPFKWSLKSHIPQARGLGSSASIRLGILAGLNALSSNPLNREELLEIASQLEGHPDNVTPALFGGFTICGPAKILRCRIESKLFFVAIVPQIEIPTELSRSILPTKIKLKEAIQNLQRATLMAICFFQKKYEALSGLFVDYFHEPYRLPAIPFWEKLRDTSLKAGALGFYLSGSGSTLMSLAYKNPTNVVQALKEELLKLAIPGEILVLKPDNFGLRIAHLDKSI